MDQKTIKMLLTVTGGVLLAGLVMRYGRKMPLLVDAADGFNNSIV